MAERLSALRTGRDLLPKNNLSVSGTHFCYRLSKLQAVVRLEGLGKLKINPFASSGLEPAIFRLVA
jgi:hypothetical protein